MTSLGNSRPGGRGINRGTFPVFPLHHVLLGGDAHYDEEPWGRSINRGTFPALSLHHVSLGGGAHYDVMR